MTKEKYAKFFYEQWEQQIVMILGEFNKNAEDELRLILRLFHSTLLHVLAEDMEGVTGDQLNRVILPLYQSVNVLSES